MPKLDFKLKPGTVMTFKAIAVLLASLLVLSSAVASVPIAIVDRQCGHTSA